ncbi:MAG: nucleoside triphosphate pyrophosphohydrolase [Pseudomonadota bacterium]
MSDIRKLLDIMVALRDPNHGCPWDIAQTFSSVAPYTVEESYEVADAIEREDMDDLKDELGDLLLNIVFHAQIADERGLFDFSAVVESICEKMIRRHPHVFEPDKTGSQPDLHIAWEAQKAEERRAKRGADARDEDSALAGVALALPALMRAQKLGKRASRVGFDWRDIDPVIGKIREELEECEEALGESKSRQHEEIGDLLFAVVNLARHAKVDAEQALRDANNKFQARFERVEQGVRNSNQRLEDCSELELDTLWEAAKSRD